jgi:hypothetical protein
VGETKDQKRKRILNSERNHAEPPAAGTAVAAAGAVMVVAAGAFERAPREEVAGPFQTLLADTDKWDAPRGKSPTSVVIHSTDADNPASSTANFFNSPADSGSAQAVADNDGGFTCVPDDAVCAGAPPLNQEGLHIEQPGLVTDRNGVPWTRDVWLSHSAQLTRVAFWTAQKCKTFDIPIRLLEADDLVREGEGARGITSHKAVSEAFHQSSHTDPGPNFPWDVFMELVQGFSEEDELSEEDRKRLTDLEAAMGDLEAAMKRHDQFLNALTTKLGQKNDPDKPASALFAGQRVASATKKTE